MQHKTQEKTQAAIVFKAHVHPKDIACCIEFCTKRKSENQLIEVLKLFQDKTSAACVLADSDPPRIGPPGPYLLADLDPLTKLSKNITIQNFLVESDNNSESRLLEKFFRKYVFKVGTF